ncbi:sugar efflux transporter [Motilimonas sp. 1_MG-2023]|uniref:sugar efflux transporter n=1 Tax=Motilimonas TaxID=1914248 RepID=UPI001E4F789B|nr:sugar efflux transporter [Motilimonas sp. 1_MG-2023]MCE0557255.1 sugar efflux transporter [Motilimonas sp. E26]MDO6526148.1 sugar efflux transporter [Motilimonas sp. 1_MG-2023]
MIKKYCRSLFPNNQIDSVSLALLFSCFVVGVAGSFTIPTMSLFMNDEVGVRPALLGGFFAALAISGVLVSQGIAYWSDSGIDRKKLILICNLMGVIGFSIFAFSRDYYVLLASAMLFMSTSSAALPQMFALAREILDRRKQNAEKFSSVLRAQIALAWVAGPPLAFFIADGFGFRFLFLLAALMYVLLTLVVLARLPSLEPVPPSSHASDKKISLWRDKDLLLLSASFVFMYAANNMYLISMPLYIAKELQLAPELAGMMMGGAALLEIPVMLMAGTYALRFGKHKLICCSVLAGTAFYIGILLNESLWGFIALQCFNGIFVGVTSALGISYFQDLKPDKIGQVTTLYANSIKTGGVLSGVMAGFIADSFGFYSVFIACTLLTLLAFFTVLRVRHV